MKKVIIALMSVMFFISCGGSNEPTSTESTYGPVGIDSSNILPPLTDSAKNALSDSVDSTKITPIELGEKPKNANEL